MTTTYTETNLTHATGSGVNTETGLAPIQSGAVILREWSDLIIRNVKDQSDEKLIECAQDAKFLEQSAFRVRGACALELKNRIRQRLKLEGRSEQTAIGKQMAELAREIGCAAKTLDDDCRITETFSDILRGDTELDREYFLRALPAPDPHAAIEFALHMKATTPGFSAEDLRQHVVLLNQGQDKEKLERESWIKIPLNPAQKDALEYLKHRRNKAPKDLFGDWLVSEANVSRSTK